MKNNKQEEKRIRNLNIVWSPHNKVKNNNYCMRTYCQNCPQAIAFCIKLNDVNVEAKKQTSWYVWRSIGYLHKHRLLLYKLLFYYRVEILFSMWNDRSRYLPIELFTVLDGLNTVRRTCLWPISSYNIGIVGYQLRIM